MYLILQGLWVWKSCGAGSVYETSWLPGFSLSWPPYFVAESLVCRFAGIGRGGWDIGFGSRTIDSQLLHPAS